MSCETLLKMNIAQADRLRLLVRQRERIERRFAADQALSRRYSWARLLLFVAGVGAAVVALFAVGQWLFWLVLAVATVGFALVVHRHQQIDMMAHKFALLGHFVAHQIARIELDWGALPASRAIDPRYDHPYEADLDLVGERSLHRVLDIAVSAQGSARLREWLTPVRPDGKATRRRQQLVRELIPHTLFRHRLVVDGQLLVEEQAGWDAAALLAWLERRQEPARLQGWLVALAALAGVNLVLFAGAQWWEWAPYWRVSLGFYAALYLLHGRLISGAFGEATALRDDLQRLLAVFRHVEQFQFSRSPGLRQLCAPLQAASLRPSRLLSRIGWVAAATGLQGNPLLALALNAVAPWGFYFAFRLERHKAELAAHLPDWLDCWYELEALGSLANAAYLQPHATFPTLHDKVTSPVFRVTGLGHPLLPEATKVRNDFRFERLGELVILTGSNMAGKSTFLKALGVNLALASAGGVVDAEKLETTHFRLFTCIKVSDSVTNGISYFYAEVRRLKALLDALEADEPTPLFFCIDEIFRGTNNRERLLGSQAYIQALVGQQGVGLIATHDLELARLADTSPAIANYHFRDDVREPLSGHGQGGTMTFDYRLRPGPSPTTNALKLMRSAGLPVPPAAQP